MSRWFSRFLAYLGQCDTRTVRFVLLSGDTSVTCLGNLVLMSASSDSASAKTARKKQKHDGSTGDGFADDTLGGPQRFADSPMWKDALLACVVIGFVHDAILCAWFVSRRNLFPIKSRSLGLSLSTAVRPVLERQLHFSVHTSPHLYRTVHASKHFRDQPLLRVLKTSKSPN